MKRTFDVVILNQKFTIRSDADERHVKKVTDLVNRRMHDLMSQNPNMSTLQAAILSCLNVTDDYLKVKQSLTGRLEAWIEKVKGILNRLESH